MGLEYASDAFIKGIQKFSTENRSFYDYIKKFNLENLTNDDVNKIQHKLIAALVDPTFTVSVGKCFPQKILYFITTGIDLKDEKAISYENHIRNCVVLSRLIDINLDIESFIVKYFDKYPSPFAKYDSLLQPKVMEVEVDQHYSEIDDIIVHTTYMLLRRLPQYFKNKWNWSQFMEIYYDHNDSSVRWKYLQCLKLATGMDTVTSNELIHKYLYERISNNCSINDESFENAKRWKVLKTQKCKISNEPKSVTNINGIYVPVASSNCQMKINIVEVNSTKNNLKKIVLGIASNKGINLVGSVGSGKTILIEYIAEKTGRVLGENFIKIQLGDQTDSKVLLGTYRCTDIPGEFVWQPGVLTQAVIDGSWLLLEDIDSASSDIISVLCSLLENGYLTVPGYRDCVLLSPEFRLFTTQRLSFNQSGYHQNTTGAISSLHKQLFNVHVDPLSSDELEHIIQTLHPQLKTISNRIINIFNYLSNNPKADMNSFDRNARYITTRDLFKWCSRAIVDFDVSSSESGLKILQDAIDVFCCSYSNYEERSVTAKAICAELGIIREKVTYFFTQYKPDFSFVENCLKSGRSSIQINDNPAERNVKFCFTRAASCLLERVMCCIKANEPVLLVGETGTGKTSTVQYLSRVLGQQLIVINMNQQSDSADLLGGFKPTDMKFIINPIRTEFERLLSLSYDVNKNKTFLGHVTGRFNEGKYSLMLELMKFVYRKAMGRFSEDNGEPAIPKLGSKRKREERKNKKADAFKNHILNGWIEFGKKLEKLEQQIKHKNALAFSFVEGSLVKAVEKGYWVLLDEINLASAETLDCLSGLLEGAHGSINLLERGDRKPIKRHANFTLFACMNPSTDVGKRNLPAGLRNRFTELFVDELTDERDLLLLVNNYLESLKPEKRESIVKFYLKVRKEALTLLCDGLGHKPHFSLRTLCRALMIASKNPCGTFARSLYEAFCLSFLTQLDHTSYKLVESMIAKYMVGSEKQLKGVLKQPIPKPQSSTNQYLQFEGYWISEGNQEPETPPDYILTTSVRKNLKDLTRIVSIGKLPILLQGETSVGKTSLITYLAKASGNKCVRINNHEHTDLQEYIGSYVADVSGKLVFREGVLVEAMREGYWIILDELNLAPSDVLEALNRVLDDNRELYIPETQKLVKAHPNFMLFATQNPPGLYGGRKMLSRAFRNRFVELHFNEIPHDELEIILQQRCQLAPSYAKKIINVMKDFQTRRRGSAAFAGKYGFITLRDLFRWGDRYRLSEEKPKLYDWDQHLADEGYLVLAGKVRKEEEKLEISQVIKKHLRRDVDPKNLFTLSPITSTVTRSILEKIEKNKDKYSGIVWTYNMRQMAVLVEKAIEFHEPVLIVGETGCGKTTICDIIAQNNSQRLVTVNCHMHTESSDFIGGLRPVRDHSDGDVNKLFEWVDGPLIQAMNDGNLFLVDEISLADDSVLERLNSLLEPERTLLLAEKGIDINNQNNSEMIVAHNNFHFIGTMNPGGDYGKKELSPALRNRFTEIWSEPCSNHQDFIEIINHNIKTNVLSSHKVTFGNLIMDFIDRFKEEEIGKNFVVTVRDVLTWVNFINSCAQNSSIKELYLHGARITMLDSIGSGLLNIEGKEIIERITTKCLSIMESILKQYDISQELSPINDIQIISNQFTMGPFSIKMGDHDLPDGDFMFNAPTTYSNTLRVVRGMQLSKAILLEGSPGVGKTSLVTALAKVTKNKLYRINLSDQTDISDLFGADLPVEGGQSGQFSWRDGPLLQALKKGHWILLDELNLASQSVLEGLNACLDHRGEIFIPELGKTFYVTPGTKFFACQNPLKQGGSRRGLPKSFLNRFTQVYVESLITEDYICILRQLFPQLPKNLLEKMVKFNSHLVSALSQHSFGHSGGPWEYNLRDLMRWCEVIIYHHEGNTSESKRYHPEKFVEVIYANRLRKSDDRVAVCKIFENVFRQEIPADNVTVYVTATDTFIGDVLLKREASHSYLAALEMKEDSLILRSQMQLLRNLAFCVNMNWMSILVGNSGCGKTSVVRTLAGLTARTLLTLPVTSAMDTSDLLGGFEQTDYTRHLEELVKQSECVVFRTFHAVLLSTDAPSAIKLLQKWEKCRETLQLVTQQQTMSEETTLFVKKVENLMGVLEYLETFSTTADVQENLVKLKERVKKLLNSVQDEGSLNAGGKFEWVDSILIKCLVNGYWLLVENVNLCSPAVLDRLNPLLEQNGVLTVSERGVNADGQMIEIKPHKDFRLFFTMNPKNGEISRAMRNRGIEQYILNENECIENLNKNDIKSLIFKNGLTEIAVTNSLLKMHEFISDLVTGEKPSVNHLIQSSFLISQQARRGIDIKEAVLTAVIDVYYKSRPNYEFLVNDVDDVIRTKVLDILETENVKNKTDLFNSNSTMKISAINSNAQLCRIKQQFSTFEKYLENNTASSIAYYLFNHFYSVSSGSDLKLRHMFFAKYYDNLKLGTFKELNTIFFDYLKNINLENVDLPFDGRWIPGTSYQTRSNNIFLSLYFLTRKFISASRMKNQENTNKECSIFKYIASIKNNIFADRINDVVVREILPLLDEFDNFVLIVLSEKVFEISNEDCIEVISLLQWRQYVYYKLEQNINKTKEIRLREIISELHVHYKWFVKYCINKFKQLLNAEESSEIIRIINKINSTLSTHFNDLQKIGKRYKKSICSPPPLINENQMDLMTQFNQANDALDLCRNKENVNKIIPLLLTKKEIYTKLKNIKYKLSYNSFEEPEELKEIFIECADFVNTTDIPPTCVKSDVQFLPVSDYFSLISVYKARSHHENILPSLTIPMNLQGVLQRYNEEKDVRLNHEINSCITNYLLNAISTTPNKFLNYGEDAKDVKLFWHAPMFAYLVTNLLVLENSNSSTVSTPFGEYRNSSTLYNNLNLTIWNNMHRMSSFSHDFLKMDFDYMLKSYKKFLETFANSLRVEPSKESDLLDSCIKKIQELYKHESKDKESEVFLELLNEFRKNMNLYSQSSSFLDKLSILGNCYISLNYVKALLNSKLSPIDPFLKNKLRRKYVEMELNNFEDLKCSYDIQNEIYTNGEFPLCKFLKEKISELTSEDKKLKEYVAVRPESPKYESIVEHVQHAFSTILSTSNFMQDYTSLNNSIATIHGALLNGERLDTKEFSLILAKDIATRIQNFSEMLHKYRATFPDIVEPLYSNLLELVYGIRLKESILRKLILQYANSKSGLNLNENLLNLVQFPTLSNSQPNQLRVINLYMQENMQGYILKILNSTEQHTSRTPIRLLKCAILETYNSAITNSKCLLVIDEVLVKYFDDLLSQFVISWNKQQEDIEKAIVESESLYKIKSQCDKTEDEQIQEDFEELFPTFHDTDFKEFQKHALGDDNIEKENPKNPSEIIQLEDVKYIYELHKKFMKIYTKSQWIKPTAPSDSCDHVTPLMEKYKLFKLLLESSIHSLDYQLDRKLLGSLSVLINFAQNYGTSNSKVHSFDFYRDSNVEEVKGSYHSLKELEQQISKYLEEWPEHPTLKDIKIIITRLYNFDITSPLSRFLTGFEILLSKCHEWEQNAHSGVSLQAFTSNITQQIISWRKLELNVWKGSLDITFERMNSPIAKWWCYLYNIMEQFENDSLAPLELISTIQKFITNSNLAEFENRLELLLTYHQYCIHVKSKKFDLLGSILWNLHQYYLQFLPNILAKIKEFRAPIEKKLKDFVKIVKWKDISYWAVKDTLVKTHKAIHKHMREFENVLKQSVFPFLHLIQEKHSGVGIWDKPKNGLETPIDYNIFISTEIRESIPENFNTEGVLFNLTKYFNKSKLVTQKIIAKTPYPGFVQELEDFIAKVIETSEHLQSLEVTKSLPKSKQKSQAKNILQQKRRCLADLFKTLSKIGLSYKKGILELQEDRTRKFTTRPIDLEPLLTNATEPEKRLLDLWSGCELYYWRSLIRLDILESSLVNPSKELGMSDLERCKGFPVNLMNNIREQKERLIESSEELQSIRNQASYLKQFCTNTDFVAKTDLIVLVDNLKNAITIIDQYTIILRTCPEQNNLESISNIPILTPQIPTALRYKHEELWESTMTTLHSTVQMIEKVLDYLKNNQIFLENYELDLKYVPVPNIKSLLEGIESIENNLKTLRKAFGGTSLFSSLKWIKSEISQSKKKLSGNYKSDIQSGDSELSSTLEKFKSSNEALAIKMLLSIQNVSKKLNQEKETTEDGEEEQDLKDNHLNKLTTEGLFDCLSMVNMKGILKNVTELKSNLLYVTPKDYPPFKTIITDTLPLLDQIILLHQFFLTQQVAAYRVSSKINSILLNIFIDLACKGFCIPSDLSEELCEEGAGQQSGGMGLGDGEGEKDVSDRIESEDQLEDAKPEGETKQNEEDKDCKEEEKGIEMSDDFDSKLQDVEKNGDEEEEDSKSDAEEQMGDTEQGADQLDEEIWGSDNENEENDDKGDSKEEKGDGGESLNDQQMGAKENESEEQDDQNGSKPQNQEKEINEMDENEYDDQQVDPYHGNQQEMPEPEPMDLGDDLQLDEDAGDKEENDGQEENPFDIDAMKDKMPEINQESEETKEDQNDDKVDDVDNDTNKDGDSEEIDDDQKMENEQQDQGQPEDNSEDKGDNLEDVTQSSLDQTNANDDVQPMDVDDNAGQSSDNVQTDQCKKHNSDQNVETTEDNQQDSEGAGQRQSEENQGGHDDTVNAQQQTSSTQMNLEQKEQMSKIGESDSKRSLGDASESVKKKLKTIHADNQKEDVKDVEQRDSDMYQHIEEAEKHSDQVLDTATKEQVEEQKAITNQEEGEQKMDESCDQLPPDDKDGDVNMTEATKQKSQTLEEENRKKSEKGQHPDGDVLQEIENVEIEGDVVQTMTVPRGGDSYYNPQPMELESIQLLSREERNNLRQQVEQQLSTWNEPPSTETAQRTWEKISAVTSLLAHDLAEQLRLVLEPTQASRLKGDFRTGKRINMRKIIPYIASQFRKDKIWLRRTKPAKREYQIVLAIDNSSSMADNHSKELAFESVALISRALTLLESGELSILSFGENTEVLHKLNDPFTERSGSKLLQKFQFTEKKTCVGQMVNFAAEMLNSTCSPSSTLNAKLLVVVSDGRGIFSEGETFVLQAIRNARISNVFMIFVIIDNPESNSSILDIRRAVFKSGTPSVELKSYMDSFPFPYYLILRDINALPSVLSDALHQWFEMISNNDK